MSGNDSNPRFGFRNSPPELLSKLWPYAIALAGVVVASIIIAYLAGMFRGGGTTPPGDAGATLGPGSATLVTTNAPANATGNWVLDGLSADVSPTASMIAGVWTKAVDNVVEGYADIITITMGGTIASGTRATDADIKLSFSISRTDATGSDLFLYVFDSAGGECQVTMSPAGDGLTGTFTCSGVPGTNSVDGAPATADATGSFSLE